MLVYAHSKCVANILNFNDLSKYFNQNVWYLDLK